MQALTAGGVGAVGTAADLGAGVATEIGTGRPVIVGHNGCPAYWYDCHALFVVHESITSLSTGKPRTSPELTFTLRMDRGASVPKSKVASKSMLNTTKNLSVHGCRSLDI